MSLNMFCRNREISISFRLLRVEGKLSKCGIGSQRRRSGGTRVGGRNLSLDDSSFSFNFFIRHCEFRDYVFGENQSSSLECIWTPLNVN